MRLVKFGCLVTPRCAPRLASAGSVGAVRWGGAGWVGWKMGGEVEGVKSWRRVEIDVWLFCLIYSYCTTKYR